MTALTMTPRAITQALDAFVVDQDEAKRVVAVAVYTHYRKVARARRDDAVASKTNVLLIGPSGTGKTLMCETLGRILGVPFATAEATSLAQTQFVNEEIQAILQRLVDRAGGDVARAAQGIVFIDEIDKLKASGPASRTSGESVQHALLKIMEGAQVRLADGRYVDTTDTLFICGGAFVGLDDIIRSQTHGYAFIATEESDSRRILDRLNSRVKPTDLFAYGLIPEFTGRLPIIARFRELDRAALVRIMTAPRNALYGEFQALFADEGVQLVIEPKVFDQIAEIALEYKTGARSLRGLFEELLAPALYRLPDERDIVRVGYTSIFNEPVFERRAAAT